MARGQHGAADAGDKVTGLVLMAAAVSAISSLLYGYDTGIILHRGKFRPKDFARLPAQAPDSEAASA